MKRIHKKAYAILLIFLLIISSSFPAFAETDDSYAKLRSITGGYRRIWKHRTWILLEEYLGDQIQTVRSGTIAGDFGGSETGAYLEMSSALPSKTIPLQNGYLAGIAPDTRYAVRFFNGQNHSYFVDIFVTEGKDADLIPINPDGSKPTSNEDAITNYQNWGKQLEAQGKSQSEVVFEIVMRLEEVEASAKAGDFLDLLNDMKANPGKPAYNAGMSYAEQLEVQQGKIAVAEAESSILNEQFEEINNLADFEFTKGMINYLKDSYIIDADYLVRKNGKWCFSKSGKYYDVTKKNVTIDNELNNTTENYETNDRCAIKLNINFADGINRWIVVPFKESDKSEIESEIKTVVDEEIIPVLSEITSRSDQLNIEAEEVRAEEGYIRDDDGNLVSISDGINTDEQLDFTTLSQLSPLSFLQPVDINLADNTGKTARALRTSVQGYYKLIILLAILGMVISIAGAAVKLITCGSRAKNEVVSSLTEKFIILFCISGFSGLMGIVLPVINSISYDSVYKSSIQICSSIEYTEDEKIALGITDGEGTEKESLGVDTVKVPSVIGKTLDSAIKTLEKDGFSVNYYIRYDASAKAGCVFNQIPAPGELANRGGTVELLVNSTEAQKDGADTTKFAVPDVKGLTQDAAKAAISDKHLSVSVVTKADKTVAKGIVMSQSPEPGEYLDQYSPVVITVSLGPKSISDVSSDRENEAMENKVTGDTDDVIKMPDVGGKSRDKAVDTLEKKGLIVTVLPRASDTVPEGQVIQQEPVKNAKVAKGAEVVIVISTGPDSRYSGTETTVTVPNLYNYNRANAVSKLKELNLKVMEKVIPSDKQAGKVINQSPAAGTAVSPGQEVIIYISGGSDISYDEYGEDQEDVDIQSIVSK